MLGGDPRQPEAVYRLRTGATFYMEPGKPDVRAINEVWLDRVYEPAARFVVRNGWTVIDLGAHRGTFSVRAALSGPETEVYAVEPSPRNLEWLRKNIEINELANVHVHEAAVAHSSGRAVLHLNLAESGRTSLLIDSGDDNDVLVETLLLDELLRTIGRPVDLLKIDIEGAEHQVLASVPEDGLRRIRRIAMEYHATPDRRLDVAAAELRALLERRGFCCMVIAEPHLLFAEAASVATKGALV
jgi:FkbM family methyltransferase